MSVLISILLGLVQGITEFLPVSSSGHLSILQNLLELRYDEGGHLLFDALLQLGTLVSLFIVYRPEIRGIAKDAGSFILKRGDEGRTQDGRMKPGLRMLYLIIIGTIPMIFTLFFVKFVDQLYIKMAFVAFAMLVTGALLYVSDKFTAGKKTEKSCRFFDAFMIGLAQMVSVIPGLSRAGMTITVGLARGCSRDFAVRFAFLLAIPAGIVSFLSGVVKALRAGIVWANVPVYLLGMVIAAVIGIVSLLIVRKLAASGKLGKLCYYCWAAGLVILIISFIL